jgi:rare lipoprotein A
MNKRNIVIGLSLLTVVLLSGCVTKRVETREYDNNIAKQSSNRNGATKKRFKRVTYGKASWYSRKFDGKKTASGEIFSSSKRTASHRTLPFNTMVKVTDMVTNRSEIVRINDRGPFTGNRIIDLSYISAKKLGLVKRGVTDVKLEIVGSGGKIDRRLLSLSTSNKACVGDDCKASLSKADRDNRVASTSQTWATKSTKARYKPVIESVYGDNMVKVQSPNSIYSTNRIINVIESDPSSVDKLPKINNYSQKVSVQVGAFRQYSGAEVSLREYNMLHNKRKAVIKNGYKDAKPIYRVQIEGFGTESEARRFISKYKHTLNGAFLVRR